MNDFEQIQQSVLLGNSGSIGQTVQSLLDAGTSAQLILDDHLLPAMGIVGERFKRNEMFLPQVLMSAQAMQTAIDILKPRLLKAQDGTSRQKVIIGTVMGDMHDIGKNLVKIMLTGAGYDVIDLGVNVPAPKFREEARSNEAQIICLSALLSSTMNNMKQVVELIRNDEDLMHSTILVGGAPVSKTFADDIGADGYAPTAPGTVDILNTILSEKQS